MTTIRRPQPGEYGPVRALIETVANETFSDLFAPNPVPLEFDDEDWPLAWVGVSHEKIVGDHYELGMGWRPVGIS
jgi:hypothetical protein